MRFERLEPVSAFQRSESARDFAEGGLDTRRGSRSSAAVNDALAGGLRERLRRGGDWSNCCGRVASGDCGASLLDGGAQRAANGLVTLGAHEALAVTFLCGGVISHRSRKPRYVERADAEASGLHLARVGRFGIVTLLVNRELGRYRPLVVGALAARADIPTTFGLPSRRNHQNTFKKGPERARGAGTMSEGSGLVNARPGIPALPGRFRKNSRIPGEKWGFWAIRARAPACVRAPCSQSGRTVALTLKLEPANG